MKRLILMGCLCTLGFGALAQGTSRIGSGTPLRWGMQGSLEIMEGDLTRYYGSADSAAALRSNQVRPATAWNGNPHATRFAQVRPQCNLNNMQLSWVAVQQQGADMYEIEQSTNGRNWQTVGVVPAKKFDLGETSYNFTYARNSGNAVFRIAAISTSGEKIYSSLFESPCSSDAYLGVDPNPVYSTTTLRIGSGGNARVKLLVLDTRGVVLQSRDANLMQGTNHLPVDLSSLPAGHYTLVVRWTNGKQETLPVVKQ